MNRYNQTLQMIMDLYTKLYEKENAEVMDKCCFTDDFKEKLPLRDADSIFANKDYRNKIFEILNFFEILSVAVDVKHIDKKVLKEMAGYRIIVSFEKLYPFIQLLSDHYVEPKNRPYQHFESLYRKLKKWYEGGKR